MVIRTALRRTGRAAVFVPIVLALYGDPMSAVLARNGMDDENGRVHARFDFSTPENSPFPSDYFTVADNGNNTGRRLALPYPDCSVYVSDCQDLDVVNTLDGFGLQTRISIPFDGQINPDSVNSHTMFVIRLSPGAGPGAVVGINQIVWDPATLMLHVETDELLRQHERYAVIVTRGVTDSAGVPVKATKEFRHLRTDVASWYRDQLVEALDAATRIGVKEQAIVVASVFSTQSVTSVMERIRDRIKAGTPDAADFALGAQGQRAVFTAAQVTGIAWKQQVGTNPSVFQTVPIDLNVLQVVPGAIGTIAYGRYVSPDYNVHPGEYIPSVATRTGVPVVQGYNTIYFTLFLPSTAKPDHGWPVALIGGGTTSNQHFTSGNFASKLAANGIAAIGINSVGQGFGPLGTLTISTTVGLPMTIPDAGRGIDQNGDHVITNTEGSEASAPRNWTISSRDANRQTVVDLMQLVRVIQAGMDVDGDDVADIDPSRIYFVGASAGSMFGTVFMALEPAVSVGTMSAVPGVIPEHARWQPNRRPMLGAALSAPARTPSLINPPGLIEIDGVAVNGPWFDENKPLRNQAPVINTVEGAMAIQKALELAEMVEETGLTPVVWARHLREEPLPGLYPKSVIYQFATGDQQAVNPGTTALIRAGNLADRTLYYRHDLASIENPMVPKNPHLFAGSPTHPNPLFRSISRGAQDQIGVFLASGGTQVIHPEPSRFFEVPISSPLPETLNFIR